MFGLSLMWERCPDGIELAYKDETVALESKAKNASKKPRSILASYAIKPASKTILGMGRKDLYARYRTSERVPVQLDLTRLDDPLVLRFINARDDEKRQQFFHAYGLFDDHWTYWDTVLDQQRDFTKLIWRAGGTDRIEAITTVHDLLASRLGFALTPKLEMVGKQATRLALIPQSLFTYMVMEVAMIPAYNVRTTACEHCEKVFLTGPLTDRRSHAKYCSDKCRVAAMRKRNAAGV